MSSFTVDPGALISRPGLGRAIRSIAGSWTPESARMRDVGHLDASASAATARFAERCDSGVAAVAAMAAMVDRLVSRAGHRYSDTEADVQRAAR
jgi:hypothetical protein